jgi:hypothetical protein
MRSILAISIILCCVVAGIGAQKKSEDVQVQVTLTSDFNTWVGITNTRVPRKFHTLTVTLPPGDYEVVGRRKGYMDVTKALSLRANMAPISLEVVCTVRVDQ